MQESLKANMALILNVLYFALAATATIYIVAEAWHYGVLFTPFPVMLTVIAQLFVAAAIIGSLYFKNNIGKIAALVVICSLWTAAVAHGAYFCSKEALHSLLSYFFLALLIQTAVLVAAAQQGLHRYSITVFAGHHLRVIRAIALALPLPLIAYAALSLYVTYDHSRSQVNFGATTSFIRLERLLFGLKRADSHFDAPIAQCLKDKNFPLAERYAKLAIANAENPPLLCFDPVAIEQRQAFRHECLGMIYALEDKQAKAIEEYRLSYQQNIDTLQISAKAKVKSPIWYLLFAGRTIEISSQNGTATACQVSAPAPFSRLDITPGRDFAGLIH